MTKPASAPPADAREPDPALLVSMATCLNHGFGLLPSGHQTSMLLDMRKLWDEVMGRGYYKPANRDRYMEMLAASAQAREVEAVPIEHPMSFESQAARALGHGTAPKHIRRTLASLDMRGRLVIDVKGAVKAGVWDGEIAAARMLGRVLRSKAAKRSARTRTALTAPTTAAMASHVSASGATNVTKPNDPHSNTCLWSADRALYPPRPRLDRIAHMKLPVMLHTEFTDGKTTTECLNTIEEFQLSLQNAQTLSGTVRVIVFEHHQTLTKQTVWAEPPVTH